MEEFDINPEKFSGRQRRPRVGQRTPAYHEETDPESAAVHEEPATQPRYEEQPRHEEQPRRENHEPVAEPYQQPQPERPRRKRRPRAVEAGYESPEEETRTVHAPQPEPKAPIDLLKPFRDRRLQNFFAVVLIVIGVVMAVMLVSHLASAGEDQSRVLNETVDEMAREGKVANKGGAFGAWLSHALFTDAMGIGSFVIALYLIIVGGCIIAARRFNFWALTFKSVLLAVALSVITGLVTYSADTEVVWGGTHGHGVNKFLFENTGFIGALAVSIILLAAVIAVFYFPLRTFYRKCRTTAQMLNEKRRRFTVTRQSEDRNERHAEPQPEPVRTTALDETAATVSGQQEIKPVTETPAVAREPETPAEDTAISFDDDETAGQPQGLDDSGRQAEQGAYDSPFEVSLTKLDDTQGDTPEGEKEAKPTPVSNVRRDHRDGLYSFRQPSLELLDNIKQEASIDVEEQENNRTSILDTLAQFHVGVKDIKATIGPTVTLYELTPEEGVRPQDIKRLEENLAMGLRSKNVRVVTMTENGTVGIEVPNANRQTVSMRSVLASKKFQETDKPLPVALGANIQNEVFMTNIAKMPHLLVAGATGMGKSVGLNAIITSLLFKKHPTELKMVLIDPKMVEFTLYAPLINHYLAKLPDDDDDAIITDTAKVLSVLNSLCIEMDDRYALLKKAGEREIEGYNAKFESGALNEAEGHKYLPYIVLIVDEFADLILTGGKEIETPIMRIAQKGRAAGMHMIIATQRPSRQVLTGLIKANCPARIAFRVTQRIDSGIILDEQGADALTGRGDMIYKNGDVHERVQCAFISNQEVDRVVRFIASQPGPGQPYFLPDPALAPGGNGSASAGNATGAAGLERDAMFDEIARAVVNAGQGSTSWIQRNYGFGYNRAGKLMDQLCAAGIVGPVNGSKPRAILVDPMTLEDILAQKH